MYCSEETRLWHPNKKMTGVREKYSLHMIKQLASRSGGERFVPFNLQQVQNRLAYILPS